MEKEYLVMDDAGMDLEFDEIPPEAEEILKKVWKN